MTRSEILAELPDTTFIFNNQKAKIGKRSSIKPGQAYLYAYFPDKEKPFRNLSSLYFTPTPTLLALEFKKKYYTLNVSDLSITPDPSKSIWNSSKGISQHIIEGGA